MEETPVIWVHSTSIHVVEAVFRVYKEYETFFSSKSILIHHDFEENEDLFKKIGVQKLQAFDKIIRSLKDSVPIAELNEIIHTAANKALSEENIRRLCFNVHLKEGNTNIGTTESHSYFCRSPWTVWGMRRQLIGKTLEAISKSFASEICQGILKHIESKIRMNLEMELGGGGFNFIISPEVFTTVMLIGSVILSLFIPLAGIVVAMLAVIGAFLESVDVNSKYWRKPYADEIYETVRKKRTSIERNILYEIETMCEKTKKDLQAVSTQINDLKQELKFPDQDTCKYSICQS